MRVTRAGSWTFVVVHVWRELHRGHGILGGGRGESDSQNSSSVSMRRSVVESNAEVWKFGSYVRMISLHALSRITPAENGSDRSCPKPRTLCAQLLPQVCVPKATDQFHVERANVFAETVAAKTIAAQCAV